MSAVRSFALALILLVAICKAHALPQASNGTIPCVFIAGGKLNISNAVLITEPKTTVSQVWDPGTGEYDLIEITVEKVSKEGNLLKIAHFSKGKDFINMAEEKKLLLPYAGTRELPLGNYQLKFLYVKDIEDLRLKFQVENL